MKRRFLTLLAGPVLLASLAAPSAAQIAKDPLLCFVDADGRGARPGQDVRDRDGQIVGWLSISQCGPGRAPGELHVRLDSALGGEVMSFDAAKATAGETGVVLTFSRDEVARRAAVTARSAEGGRKL